MFFTDFDRFRVRDLDNFVDQYFMRDEHRVPDFEPSLRPGDLSRLRSLPLSRSLSWSLSRPLSRSQSRLLHFLLLSLQRSQLFDFRFFCFVDLAKLQLAFVGWSRTVSAIVEGIIAEYIHVTAHQTKKNEMPCRQWHSL